MPNCASANLHRGFEYGWMPHVLGRLATSCRGVDEQAGIETAELSGVDSAAPWVGGFFQTSTEGRSKQQWRVPPSSVVPFAHSDTTPDPHRVFRTKHHAMSTSLDHTKGRQK